MHGSVNLPCHPLTAMHQKLVIYLQYTVHCPVFRACQKGQQKERSEGPFPQIHWPQQSIIPFAVKRHGCVSRLTITSEGTWLKRTGICCQVRTRNPILWWLNTKHNKQDSWPNKIFIYQILDFKNLFRVAYVLLEPCGLHCQNMSKTFAMEV